MNFKQESHRWIAVRADANNRIGTGHVMRCLALADEAQKRRCNVVFILSSSLKYLTDRLRRSGHEVVSLAVAAGHTVDGPYSHSHWLPHSEHADAMATLQALTQHTMAAGRGPELVVVDHYALGGPWEAVMQRIAPILVIDDLNDRPHEAAWVLDQTVGKVEADYLTWVSDSTRLLLGPQFALLRPEFASHRATSLAHRQTHRAVPRLLVTLGGTDRENVTERVLVALSLARIPCQVCVVMGFENPNATRLRDVAAQGRLDASLLDRVDDMAALMTESDLCIGAAGATSWERCALGLPSLTVTLADNQLAIAKGLDDAGAAKNFGVLSPDRIPELAETLLDLMRDPGTLYRMSQNASTLCDGRGVSRVLNKVGLSDQ
ncbi:MAG: UDP-2,4-diacetamido-2,4,6-trideoxy-beta-L-altropyranose hydrolase [Saccharospirillum sp.]